MAKQLILLILLSACAVLFQNQLGAFLNALVYVHAGITQALQIAFSEGNIGVLIQNVIALLLLPLVFAIIIATIYWLFKRTPMPQTMAIIWVVWLVLAVAIIAKQTPNPVKRTAKNNAFNIAMN